MVKFAVVHNLCYVFVFLLISWSGVRGIYFYCLVFGVSFLFRFCVLLHDRRYKTPQKEPQAKPKIPGKTALPEWRSYLNRELMFKTDGDLKTISAYFVDSISDVSDMDTEEKYVRGPFLKSWIDLGSIKEILEMLWPPGERSLHRTSMEGAVRLLESAYSQLDNEQDLFPQDKAYDYVFTQMKELTLGNRLFKTTMQSRLGIGPHNIQKGDLIFFAPQDFVFLVVRPFSPKNPQKSESQLYFTLLGESYIGDKIYWSKIHPILATPPLQTLTLRLEKTNERSDESYKSHTRSRYIRNESLWISLSSNSLSSNEVETSTTIAPAANTARKPSQSYRSESSWTKWSIISQIEAYQGTERLTAVGTGSSRYNMFWKCSCGHVGFGQYDELQPGAIQDLLKVFENHGIKAFIERCGPSGPNPTYLRLVRLQIFIANLYTWLRVCTSAWLWNKEWSPPVSMRHNRNADTVNDSSPSFKTAAEPTNQASSSNQNKNGSNTPSVNQKAPVATGAAAGTSTTPAQSSRPSPSPATQTQGNTTAINIPEDFILLCMKVKRFLTARHDLQVSTMTRDRDLFEAFRREYHSKFGWAYRQFSFQTIQKISFVQFALHPRYEVDGIKPDMPPETAAHYTCEPRKPHREPALDNDFLMHRFSSPINCFQDDICLRQFPKRVGERPTPGIDPDFYTGWGMHLEQGLDLQRIFLVLFFGIASAGTFGLVWGVCKSLQDGFSIASFIVGSEAVAVAVVQILLSVGAI